MISLLIENKKALIKDKFEIKSVMNFELEFELWNKEDSYWYKPVVVKNAYQYHHTVAMAGNKNDIDLYLLIRNIEDGKILDSFIIHAAELEQEPGYSDKVHYVIQDEFESCADPLTIGIRLEIKQKDCNYVVKEDIDSMEKYLDIRDNGDGYRKRGYEKVSLVLLDLLSNNRIIDKINLM